MPQDLFPQEYRISGDTMTASTVHSRSTRRPPLSERRSVVLLALLLTAPALSQAASAQTSRVWMRSHDTQMQAYNGGPPVALSPAANVDDRCHTASSSNLAGCDLRAADLSGRDLRHYDLRNARLQGANLRLARMSFANLEGADLTGADLTGVSLTFARLSRAKLSGALLIEADVRLADLRLADLQNATLDHADLSSTQLDGARLQGASWRGVICPSEAASDGAPCVTIEHRVCGLLAGRR